MRKKGLKKAEEVLKERMECLAVADEHRHDTASLYLQQDNLAGIVSSGKKKKKKKGLQAAIEAVKHSTPNPALWPWYASKSRELECHRTTPLVPAPLSHPVTGQAWGTVSCRHCSVNLCINVHFLCITIYGILHLRVFTVIDSEKLPNRYTPCHMMP